MKKRLLVLFTALICMLCLSAVAFADGEVLSVGAKDYKMTETSVDLSGIRSAEVADAVGALSGLSGIERLKLGAQRNTDLSWDDVRALCGAVPDAVVDYEFVIYDKYFNLNCETFDLDYIRLEDDGEYVKSFFPLMRALKTVSMDTCGVSNEVMAKMRDDYPQYEIVWRVRIAQLYGVLSNAEMVLGSCSDLAGDITTADVESFKYLTKTKYLDLGHNVKMTDISFVRSMPELEVAILAINTVQDFSPLADCPKLEYLELFNSGLSDLSCLSGLKNLKHLNICYCFGVSDISPLYELPQLERLWIGKFDPVPPEQIEKMRQIAPNCEIDVTVDDPTDGTWRFDGGDAMGNPKYADRYALLKKQFDGYTYDSYSLDPLFYFGW